MSWLPAETELFFSPDTTKNIAHTLSFELEGAQERVYSAVLTPLNDAFNVSVGAGGVLLSADDLSGVFKPEFIQFLDAGEVVQVADWPLVPPNKELVFFKSSSVSEITFSLVVNVTYSTLIEGVQADASSSQTYTFTVYHDYSVGKQKIKEYMNASSI